MFICSEDSTINHETGIGNRTEIPYHQHFDDFKKLILMLPSDICENLFWAYNDIIVGACETKEMAHPSDAESNDSDDLDLFIAAMGIQSSEPNNESPTALVLPPELSNPSASAPSTPDTIPSEVASTPLQAPTSPISQMPDLVDHTSNSIAPIPHDTNIQVPTRKSSCTTSNPVAISNTHGRVSGRHGKGRKAGK